MSSRTGSIREALSELLAPLVAKEGGLLYLSECDDGGFSLHWAGRYSGNPAARLIHEEIAVPLIRELAPGAQIRWTSGRLVPPGAEPVAPRDPAATPELEEASTPAKPTEAAEPAELTDSGEAPEPAERADSGAAPEPAALIHAGKAPEPAEPAEPREPVETKTPGMTQDPETAP